DRAAAVGSGIGTECEIEFFRGIAEMIENDSRLDARNAPFRIKLEDVRHVLRKVEYHRNIAALTGKRCPAPSAQDGHVMFAANGDRGDYVVVVSGKNHADRNLAVVRSVGGVEGAASVIEAHFTAKLAAKRGFQRLRCFLC